jgi:hypothetical protein
MMMASQDAFSFEEQQEHLNRVKSRTALAIIRFLRGHRLFHAGELHEAVLLATGIAAPASSDRILRDLRQRKLVDYEVISRRESLYQVIWVMGDNEDSEAKD